MTPTATPKPERPTGPTPTPRVVCGELGHLASDEFYMDGTAVVFTEKAHLRRGYCCSEKALGPRRARCRHCPYVDR